MIYWSAFQIKKIIVKEQYHFTWVRVSKMHLMNSDVGFRRLQYEHMLIIKNHTKSILMPPPVDLALCFIKRRTMWIVSLLMQVEVCVQVKENRQ